MTRRIITAREQWELLSPWMIEAGNKKPPLDEDWMVNNIMSHFGQVTPEQIEAGKNWYSAAREWANNIAAKTNRDPNRVYATIAALSPSTDWDSNLEQAAHFLVNYDPSIGHDPKGFLPTIGGNVRRAIDVHNAEKPEEMLSLLGPDSGHPKIHNFYRNFTGDENAVTIDRWITRVLMGENGNLEDLKRGAQALSGKGHYDQMANAIRKATQQINSQTGQSYTPAQVQAMLWLRARGDEKPQKSFKDLNVPIPDYTFEEHYDPAKADPTYSQPKMRSRIRHDVLEEATNNLAYAPADENFDPVSLTKNYLKQNLPDRLEEEGYRPYDPEIENRRREPTYKAAPGTNNPSKVKFVARNRALWKLIDRD